MTTEPVDVVFTLSLESLDDVMAREWCRPPDQTLLALAREPRIGHLTCVDPWRARVPTLLRGRATRAPDTVQVGDRDVQRLRPLRWRRSEAVDPASVQRDYVAYGRRITAARGEARPSVLVTYHPFVAAWCRPDWASRTVYVGRDDWTASQRLARWRAVYEQAYADMRRSDVACFAVSEELAQRLRPGGGAVVVPNGVDQARWRERRPPSALLAGLARPVAVYAGTIDDRLDVSLVRTTAEAVGTVVLIGPAPQSDVVDQLRRMDGVVLTGSVSQDELVAAVQGADVGVVPHVDTPLTRAMSPLKIYEYLAGGLHVVSRDLPPVRGLGDEVLLADTPEQWRTALQVALTAPPVSEDRRQARLEELSWSRRQRPVVAAVVQGGQR